MAYFGEATAHAALLGISLSLMFEFSVFAGALFVSVIMATAVTIGQGRSLFLDTLLGVAGHSCMALGLIIVSFISGVRIELMAYLIGDILAVSKTQLERGVFAALDMNSSSLSIRGSSEEETARCVCMSK